MLDRFPDIGVRGEMDDGLDPERLQRFRNSRAVGDISRDQRTPFHRPAVAGAEIVEHDRRVAGSGQRLAGMAADITGAAGDQNS